MSRGNAVYTVSVVSGATLSSALDLGQNWDYAWLAVQSMVSNSQLYIQASDSLAGTYRRVLHPILNTATIAAPPTFTVASAVTTAMIPIPNGLRFIKIEQTATADSGQSYKVLVGGN